ncbi:MAG: ATP-binding protein [Bacteroidota bacterium]
MNTYTNYFFCWILLHVSFCSTGQKLEFSSVQLEVSRLQKVGQTEEAVQHLLTYLETAQLPSEKAWSFYKLGNLSLVSDDLEVSDKYFESAYQIAKRNQLNNLKVQIQQRNTQLLYLSIALLLKLLIGVLFYKNYRRKKLMDQQKMIVLRKEKETQVLRAIIEGEEKERKRIARDLHDELGALLAATKFRIDAIQKDIPNALSLESYSKAEELIDVACTTLREISHNTMPSILEDESLEQVMEESCLGFVRSTGLQIEFISHISVAVIAPKIKLNVYRIFLELLRNAIQHAQANLILVQLTAEPKWLNLVVEDDGIGFQEEHQKNGIGLKNIRSRVEYLNGKISLQSKSQEGSSYSVDIPLD